MASRFANKLMDNYDSADLWRIIDDLFQETYGVSPDAVPEIIEAALQVVIDSYNILLPIEIEPAICNLQTTLQSAGIKIGEENV